MDSEPVTEVEFDPRRVFQLWSYRVGHSQLLLRSNPEDEYPTRVELLFKSVAAVHLPTSISALSLRIEPGESALPGWIDLRERQVYALRFSGGDGYVVAGAAFVAEDALDYTAPSAFAASLGE